MKVTNKNKKFGSSIEHGNAHSMDHYVWSRRNLLKTLGWGTAGSMLLGKLPVSAMHSFPLSAAMAGEESDRILVLIRQKGGNDGLNMIIPVYDYGTYRAKRPTIAIPEAQILPLTDAIGLPQYMEPVRNLWQEGAMKVIHNVGYPEQNLSHFRSSDIWSTASDAGVVEESGWMGRYLDGVFPEFLTNPPAVPPAVQIGSSGDLTFVNDERVNMSVLVNDPNELVEIAKNAQLYDPADVPGCYYGEQLGFLRIIANSTFRYAEVISKAYEAGSNALNYDEQLGKRLAVVARLIKGGLGTRIYMVVLDGHDTHANQNAAHPVLMSTLSHSINTFLADLSTAGMSEKVLAMTFSEFGRRIEQNASNGTDHGAAAPVMLFGKGLNGSGFIGSPPNLKDVDQVGNLKFQTDFRQLYATILENWLCIDTNTVDLLIGKKMTRINELGLMPCAISSVNKNPELDIPLSATHIPGKLIVSYSLPRNLTITVRLHNILGQPIATLFEGNQFQGNYQLEYNLGFSLPVSGYYVISIHSGGRVVSKKVPVLN